MKYAIVDIETTGGNALRDKITEIAIYLHDGEKIVDEFTSLINPECSIPPFISSLTGISNEMVENAPRFYEVAKQIIQFTEGAVFVAHNASFDYSFVRQEYKSLGFNFSRDYLCTVKLSRKIIPGFRSYSLGTLCQNLKINIENRHRAGGDALATVRLFELLLEKNKEENILADFINNEFINLRFPPGFDRTIITKIPESYGVYYFLNETGKIIYVGKSNNIKKRVLSHFANKKSKRSIEMRNSIHEVAFEETGNELVALLLESEEIKKHLPFYNRVQKRNTSNQGIYLTTDEKGYLNLSISKGKKGSELLMSANSHEHAVEVINRLVHKYHLCQKLCGVFDVAHSCFNYSVKLCKGACIGKENCDDYNIRVLKAVESLQFKNQNFMIVGEGRSLSEKSIIQVEKGKYIGFGYFEPEFTEVHPDNLKDFISARMDNRDVNRIIRSFLQKIPDKNILIY